MRYLSITVLLSSLSACAPSSSPSQESVAPLVQPGHPYAEPVINGPLTQVVGDAHPPNALMGTTDADSVHEGQFTDGANLDSPLHVSDLGSAGAWIGSLTNKPHTVAPDFATLLGQAFADAQGELGKVDTGGIGVLFSALGALGVTSQDFAQATTFIGFPVEYARWVSSWSERVGFRRYAYNYSAPTLMANQRQRGARLYCAARTAQQAQAATPGSRALGKQVGFSLTLFKKQIDFLTIEPTAVIDGPLPYIGDKPRCPVDQSQGCSGTPSVGAQAFMIPFLLGTRVTPISLLPSLPEVRYPALLVTGDSEVATPVYTSDQISASNKTYQTVTHADAFVSKDGGGSAGFNTPLFYIGPIEVDLQLGLGLTVGQLYGNDTASCPTQVGGLLGKPGAASTAMNDSLLVNPPWAHTTRAGLGSDGPWDLTSYTLDGNWDYATVYSNGAPYSTLALGPSDPMLLRALENDDRHFENTTALQLCGGLIAHTPDIPLGPINVTVSASGMVHGTVSMKHSIRDGVVAGPRTGWSQLTVTPSTHADAGFQLSLDLKIWIDLFFGSFYIFDGPVIQTPDVTLARYDSGPWAESSRLRIGTGASTSPTGDPMMNPAAVSHLPNHASFPALAQPVDQCLASTVPNAPAPPVCGSQAPSSSGPPHVNVCLYKGAAGTQDLPPALCSNVAGYVQTLGLDSAKSACMQSAYSFLCQPRAGEPLFLGHPVQSHILDWSTAAGDPTTMQSVLNQCVRAYYGNAPDQTTAKAFAQSFFSYAICDENAQPLSSRDAVQPPFDPSTAPPTTPSSCQ